LLFSHLSLKRFRRFSFAASLMIADIVKMPRVTLFWFAAVIPFHPTAPPPNHASATSAAIS
jgi:hypothetical protein